MKKLLITILFLFASNASAHVLTAALGAEIDSARTQTGFGQSGLFDQDADVTAPDSPDFNFGSGNFTVEGWFYPTANGQNGTISQKPSAGEGWGMAFYNAGLAPRPYMNIGNAACSTTLFADNVTTNTLSLNVWHHAAIVRSGSNFYFYADGTRYAPFTSAEAICNPTVALSIGDQDANNNGFIGNIDEVRISNVARYGAASITVPNNPFCPDVNTVLLAHMDGVDGTTLFLDSKNEACPADDKIIISE